MAGNKKPNRKPKHKGPRLQRIHVPMMSDAHKAIAMRLHLQIEAFTVAPTQELYKDLVRMFVALMDAELEKRNVKTLKDAQDPVAKTLRLAFTVMEAIADRYTKNGGIFELTEDDKLSLRFASLDLDAAIARHPINVFQACEYSVAARGPRDDESAEI